MKCSHCGRKISKDQKFCKYCGEPVKEKTSGNNKRKKNNGLKVFLITILILLIIIAIGFSIYYFILKKNTQNEREETIYTSEREKDDTDKDDIEEHMKSSEESKDSSIPEQEEDIIIADSVTEPINMEDVSVSCSSSLPEPQFNLYHTAENVVDGNIGTAWVEGVDGNGIGQYITFLFKDKGTISNISIYNGYQKTDDIYKKNSRPKTIIIRFGDGSAYDFELEDIQGEQTIKLDNPIETDTLTIVIQSVYPGYKYEDTAISEIRFY